MNVWTWRQTTAKIRFMIRKVYNHSSIENCKPRRECSLNFQSRGILFYFIKFICINYTLLNQEMQCVSKKYIHLVEAKTLKHVQHLQERKQDWATSTLIMVVRGLVWRRTHSSFCFCVFLYAIYIFIFATILFTLIKKIQNSWKSFDLNFETANCSTF